VDILLAGILMAQTIPYPEAAKDPNLTFRLGGMMGFHCCRALPLSRTQSEVNEMAVSSFMQYEEQSWVGFLAYVLRQNPDNPAPRSYLDGMFRYINLTCPQFNMLPIR
jgi:hypothetical protein